MLNTINLRFGLKSFSDFYNTCKNQYESDSHVYVPDYIGYQDGRISIKIDEDELQYFPIKEVWEVNHARVILSDYLMSKNIQGTEEALFWRALQDSVNSEALDINFESIIDRLLFIKKKEEYTLSTEAEILQLMKKNLELLRPLIGELKYDHTKVASFGRDSHEIFVFHSKKYGYVEISKGTNFFGEYGITFDRRYPKTWEHVLKTIPNRFYKMEIAWNN